MNGRGAALERWTEVCGSPQCRTGWLQLWRSRSAPRLEGTWACSAGCMEAMVAAVVKGRITDWEAGAARRELRMPLGLVLLSRGWITRAELNAALAAQRTHGHGRIGEWLCRLSAVSEATIAKGLAAQWNCTALTAATEGLEVADGLAPGALLHRYGLVLMRHVASARLYLAGGGRAEYASARALEHMLEVPVEAAFLEDSVWRGHSQAISSPALAVPHASGAVVQIAQAIEHRRPAQARVVRVHDHLWLRMRHGRRRRPAPSVEDIVIPLRSQGEIVRAG